MRKKSGTLSIDSENIFPIIKKWLYSDQDIFFRELISNGVDAITKRNALSLMGETDLPEGWAGRVDIILDEEEKTIRFRDNGIGMTAAEVDQYINQIAFSGAAAFLEAYKDKTSEDQIIGHFGLGFYSAFMVAERVAIDTLSWQPDAEPVHWECDGGTKFTLAKGQKEEVGTEVTLYIAEESKDFLGEYRAREIIGKYCSFLPVEIFLHTKEQWDAWLKEEAEKAQAAAEKGAEPAEEAEEKKTAEQAEGEEPEEGGESDEEEEKDDRPEPPDRRSISDIHPLWIKRPSECTEEEYREFYHRVFFDFKEPLFWIHLNMDYPFNLKGILYFPKINNEYESIEGRIKLYNNRVFIADNIKEVIPEYLMLLKGVIDCPDLPLNVSRSALQNDGFVHKISDYITRKVADRLTQMCKDEREDYEKYWDDISPFVKFGCLKDDKFYDRMKESLLFKDLDGKYGTLADLKAAEDKTVVYVTDEVQQSQYIRIYREAGMNAVILDTSIDAPFITMIEAKGDGLKFIRIDADLKKDLKAEAADEEAVKADTEALTEIFRRALDKEDLTVKAETLKDENISAMITESEQDRRMQEMMRMYNLAGMGGMEPPAARETLVLNAANPLVKFILANREHEHVELACRQLYDLARISRGPLSADEMSAFIARSNEILNILVR